MEESMPDCFSGMSLEDQRSWKIAAAAITKIKKESEVAEYLFESKPSCIREGDSLLGIDLMLLQKEFRGLADKLSIHGYGDRRERLLYLFSVLTSKLSQRDDMLKTIGKFLIEMSERPTSLIRLKLESCTYSCLPDDEIINLVDSDKRKQKQLLQQILKEDFDEPITLSFSSDSELSDWSADEETTKSSATELIEPSKNLRPSQSFSDFTNIQLPKDENEKRQEFELYWNLECIRTNNFLTSDLRNFDSTTVTKLQQQPVISGLLTLHAKFGEHWEWKKMSKQNKTPATNETYVISEHDVIKEILLQFSALNPSNSPLFNLNWTLRAGLIVPSVSRGPFASLLKQFETAFASLAKFKTFANRNIQINTETNSAKLGIPKIIAAYSKALIDVIHHLSEEVGKTEKLLKTNIFNSKARQPCSTLIQVMRQLNELLSCVREIDGIHSRIFDKPEEASDQLKLDSDCSVPLILTLAIHLNIQANPKKFGILLFLFSNCLYAFFDELNTGLRSLNWPLSHPIFERSQKVKLSDNRFWSDCIKLKPLTSHDKVTYNDTKSIPCFSNLLCEILNVMKTSEMLHQLDQDYSKIIGQPPLPEKIVSDFLDLIVPTLKCQEFPNNRLELHEPPDYKTHFKFIGLEGSLVESSVKSILLNHHRKIDISNSKKTNQKNGIHELMSLNEIPTINSIQALEIVFKKWYSPLCEKAKNCILNIFDEYEVDKSMTIFREIVLGGREDFAQAVIEISSPNKNISKRYNYEDEMNRNPLFQKLLNDCYAEGRENIEIELKLDRSTDTNYTLNVKPHFPLNLILQEDSIERYLFVSKQLHRIRKSLWETTALSIRDFKTIEGVEPNRVLLFRFALIHFCSSLRAFLVFKIFGNDKEITPSTFSSQCYDLDAARKAHRDHLALIETTFLRNPTIDNIVIRKMTLMSENLSKLWKVGIPNRTMLLLEDTLKKCWTVIRGFQRNSYSVDFHELAYHFGPAPSYM